MKCTICREKASIQMRQHRLALCKEHFLDWIPEQTERFIEKYRMFTRHDRVLVAVSGGKDSLSLWDVLTRLGYQADGLYIDLGIDGGFGYSTQSRRLSEQFASSRRLELHVVDIEERYGETIPGIAQMTQRGRGKPCSVCGLSKRHIMNQIARDLGYSVLATGHNLDDEVAVLFGNTLEWKVDSMRRQYPVLHETAGFARKVKPFCRLYERETAAYALMRGIDYIYEECPFSVGSKSLYYKGLLNRLENDRPGAKLVYYLSFLRARENELFREHEEGAEVPLNPCPTCGQPTSTNGECAFCRMMQKTSPGAEALSG
jgi:uncharacterized protein (TIGR00269 family)